MHLKETSSCTNNNSYHRSGLLITAALQFNVTSLTKLMYRTDLILNHQNLLTACFLNHKVTFRSNVYLVGNPQCKVVILIFILSHTELTGFYSVKTWSWEYFAEIVSHFILQWSVLNWEAEWKSNLKLLSCFARFYLAEPTFIILSILCKFHYNIFAILLIC